MHPHTHHYHLSPCPCPLTHATQHGDLPSDAPGKAAFLKYLEGFALTPDQMNVGEASGVYYNALKPIGIDFELQSVLDDPATGDENLAKAGCKDFWFLVRALRDFVANEGAGVSLPVTGELPDMHSSTSNYIALQKVYGDKHANDRSAFEAHLRAALDKAGRNLSEFDGELSGRFLKNVRDIRVLRTRSVAQEYSALAADVEAAAEAAGESVWDVEEELRP